MQQIGVALCAYGMSGRVFHAPFVHAHPGFILKSILRRSTQRTVIQYPHTKIATEFHQLLADPEIELVIVNTPEPTHFELAWKALEAKKHVVVEKAFTPTVEEAEKLITFAKTQNRILTVYQNRRWDSDFLTVQEVFRQKLLGRLVSYEAHYNRYRTYIKEGTWKEKESRGTGVLYNLGTHLIDQALVLFGMPNSVMADLRIQRAGGEVIDNFDLILGYDEFKALLRVSYLVRKAGPKYILHGEKGSFLKPGMDPQEAALARGLAPGTPNWGEESEDQWGTLHTDIGGLEFEGKIRSLPGDYGAFYSQVYEAITQGTELQVKPEESLNGLRIVEAALESHSQSRSIFL